MASQEEPNEVDAAMQHLRVESFCTRAPFSEPFPGLRPTLVQRRQYMRAFFQWHRYDAESEDRESELREHAERNVATAFIEGHDVTGVPRVLFEFAVDEEVWGLWFCDCPEETIPTWPWPRPTTKEGAAKSARFAELLSEYRRDGTLLPSPMETTDAEVEGTVSSISIAPTEESGEATNVVQRSKPTALIATGVEASFASTMTGRANVPQSGPLSTISAPEARVVHIAAPATTASTGSVSAAIQPSVSTSVMATSSQAVRPPVKPTEATLPLATQPETGQTASMGLSKIASASQPAAVKVTQVKEKLFPYPCTPPDLSLRMMVWESNLPGIQPAYQEPFKLSLPVDFGFWSLVWGPNGKDWSRIQQEFVDERLCLAWGYDEDYVGTTRKVIGSLQDRHLPNVKQWLSVGFVSKGSRGDDGFFMTSAPTNQKLVVRLWTTLNCWMKICLSGKWTTLLGYLQRMENRSIRPERIAKVCNTLPASYAAAQTQYSSQRSAAEQNILAIVRSERSFDNVKSLLETWVDSFEEGYAMNRHDRIELAAHVWRSRVVKISQLKIMRWAESL
ncbi:hypothetical protein ACHAO9_009899 [Fusarium lateritium]